MDHRICLDSFKLFGVEILQIGGFQVYQLDAALSEMQMPCYHSVSFCLCIHLNL